ncbi:MAG: hypothetical protein MHPSP_004036 [Paramarteilia canceri]
MASLKRAFRHANTPDISKPKHNRKSLAQGQWESKVIEVFDRIRAERANTPISKSCSTRRFQATIADYNTI